MCPAITLKLKPLIVLYQGRLTKASLCFFNDTTKFLEDMRIRFIPQWRYPNITGIFMDCHKKIPSFSSIFFGKRFIALLFS